MTIFREIGNGNFSHVREASVVGLKGFSGLPVSVAAKFSSEKVSQNDQSMLFSEAKQMTRFQHKNVVRLLGVCFQVTPCCILLELMPNGDVKSYFKAWQAAVTANGSVAISPSHLWSIALDSAAGFEYLASIKHVHRDLAARNVVLAADGTAKIGDFGTLVFSFWCYLFRLDLNLHDRHVESSPYKRGVYQKQLKIVACPHFSCRSTTEHRHRVSGCFPFGNRLHY